MTPEQKARSDRFENELLRDLPRGHEREDAAPGGNRGLFARWLEAEEMQPLGGSERGKEWTAEGGVLLGRRDGRLIGWTDNRHLLTIAGSRAGKGVSLIIPNLIFYPGSAVVIDPKGENAQVTANRRGKGVKGRDGVWRKGLGQTVHVLDPFEVSGHASSYFNPLAELKLEDPDIIEDVSTIADALIKMEGKDPHWSESARMLVRGLILAVLGEADAKRRHLVTMRRLLMLSDEKLTEMVDYQFPADIDKHGRLTGHTALLRYLSEQTGTHGHICRGLAEQLRAMGDDERGSVLSTARTQTQWLDSGRIQNVLVASGAAKTFSLADLKRSKMTLYLCLPATRMESFDRWLRLTIMLALSVMERVKEEAKPPVLFLLDEFYVLGHMRQIAVAAGLMAGFGVKLWPIVQNVGQLKENYEKSWETFFANAGAVTAFGVSDHETLQALSDNLGQMGIRQDLHDPLTPDQVRGGGSGTRENRINVPLLAPHELRLAFGRKTRRVLIFNADDNPAVAERLVYHDDDDFYGLYVPDPRYPEAEAPA